MSDFFRRMLEGTLVLRAPEGEGGATSGVTPGSTPTPQDDPQTPTTPETPTSPTTPDPASTEPGATTPPEGTTPDPAAAPAAPDRAQQRMNQLVAERWAERRRAEAAEQQARLLQEQLSQTRAALQPQATDADGNPIAQQPQVPPTRQQPPQNLQQMAEEIAANNAFNAQVGTEVQRGRGDYKDFDQVAANLQRFGELPRTFVEAALATGKGADVIYTLGKDIGEADRILSLPPIQQAVALASLAQGIKAPEAPKVVSSAPPPVTVKVGGGRTTNTPSLEDENISTADWIALREKQLADKGKGRSGARR